MLPLQRRSQHYGLMVAMLLIGLFVAGCSAKMEESSGKQANTKTAEVMSEQPHHGRAFVVGVLMCSGTSQTDALLRATLQNAGEAGGLTLDVQTLEPNAEAQYAQIDHWQSRAEAVLLCCRREDTQIAAQRAEADHLPTLVVDAMMSHSALSPSGNALPALGRVGYHAPNVGQLASEKLVDLLGGRGGVIQTVPPIPYTIPVGWWEFRNALASRREVKVLESPVWPMTTARALQSLQNHGSNLKGVICDNEQRFRLWSDASRLAKRADVVLVTFDTKSETVTTLHDGQIMRYGFAPSPETLGKTALATIGAYLRGEKVKPSVLVEPDVVALAPK